MDTWYSIAFALGMALTSFGTWKAALRFSSVAQELAKAVERARYFEERCDKEFEYRKIAEDDRASAFVERDEYRKIARTQDFDRLNWNWKWQDPELIAKFTFTDNVEDNLAAMGKELVEFGAGRSLEVNCTFKVSKATYEKNPHLIDWDDAEGQLWGKQLTCTLRGPSERIVREIGEVISSKDGGLVDWKEALVAFDLEVYCQEVPIHVVEILKEIPATPAAAADPEAMTLEEEIQKAHEEAEAEVDAIVTAEVNA